MYHRVKSVVPWVQISGLPFTIWMTSQSCLILCKIGLLEDTNEIIVLVKGMACSKHCINSSILYWVHKLVRKGMRKQSLSVNMDEGKNLGQNRLFLEEGEKRMEIVLGARP